MFESNRAGGKRERSPHADERISFTVEWKHYTFLSVHRIVHLSAGADEREPGAYTLLQRLLPYYNLFRFLALFLPFLPLISFLCFHLLPGPLPPPFDALRPRPRTQSVLHGVRRIISPEGERAAVHSARGSTREINPSVILRGSGTGLEAKRAR